MQNKRRIGIYVVLLLIIAAIVFWPRPERQPPQEDPVVPKENGEKEVLNSGPTKNGSARDLPVLGSAPEFLLRDQAGASFGSYDLEGCVWIANFAPLPGDEAGRQTILDLGRLPEQISNPGKRKLLRLVSFVVDADPNSPEHMQAIAKQANASGETWKFLAGTGDMRGFGLESLPATIKEGAPDYVSPLVLIDGSGQIRGRYTGTATSNVDAVRSDLTQLMAQTLAVPDDLFESSWLDKRKADQLKAASQLAVPHNFGFIDRAQESGIHFRHRVVADAAKNYKAVHYDHGTGMAVADVDGDGREDVYFVNQAGPNELWRNLGEGRFENISSSAGCGVGDRISVAASFADLDNDGDPDLYVTCVRKGNLLFENDGHGKFTDVTASSGLGHSGHSSGAVFFDYNRDGRLDLFLTNVGAYTIEEFARIDGTPLPLDSQQFGYYVGYKDAFSGHLKEGRAEQSLLFRNESGLRFVNVTEEAGIKHFGWSGDAHACDLNVDGWPDLYILTMQGNDEFYENVEGKGFVRKSRELFPKTPYGSMGIKIFDYDNDGDMDVFVTDMHSDMFDRFPPHREREKLAVDKEPPDSFTLTAGQSIFGNAFYRNDKEGRFVEISDRIGAENYWPWGLSVGDLNADGFDDAFLASSMNYPFRYGVNSLLLNNRGQGFVDAEFLLGVEPRRGGRTAMPWFDLDASGADRDHKHSQGQQGHVTVWAALGTRSSALFDLEGDGDLDIVTNEFNARPMLLVSDLAAKQSIHYLKIKLIGVKSNRDGLGAQVTVSAGDATYVKVHDGKSGYLSQSSVPLYFGLAGAESIKSIQVQWPSGAQQTIAGPLEVNRLQTITEVVD